MTKKTNTVEFPRQLGDEPQPCTLHSAGCSTCRGPDHRLEETILCEQLASLAGYFDCWIRECRICAQKTHAKPFTLKGPVSSDHRGETGVATGRPRHRAEELHVELQPASTSTRRGSVLGRVQTLV